MQETQGTPDWSLGGEDPLDEEVATHSSILARKILWTEDFSVTKSRTQLRDWVRGVVLKLIYMYGYKERNSDRNIKYMFNSFLNLAHFVY